MKTLQYVSKHPTNEKFNDTIIISRSTKNKCFFAYENEVKKENIMIYKIVETSKRLEAWKRNDIQPFITALEKKSCLGWDSEHEFILV